MNASNPDPSVLSPTSVPPVPLVLGARNLVVGYQGKGILPPINLDIKRGENWIVVGRNGSGKSTLLKTLLHLLPPVAGEVIKPRGMELAYVPQRVHIEPTVPMRGFDIVAMGTDSSWTFLNPFRLPDSRADIADAIRRVNGQTFASKRFDAMSGGQQQRIILAQAIVSKPSVIVLDEPTAAMDAVAERATLDVLQQLRSDFGTAVVLVTHRLSLGLRQAERACFVDAESGTVVVGRPNDVLENPVFRGHFGRIVEEEGDLG